MKIPFLQEEKNNDEIIQVNIKNITANPYQPRKKFDTDEIMELAESIKNHGIIQPVVVRKRKNGYELIAGERRIRACRSLDLRKIPAIIRDLNDQEVAEIALIENLQRKDLSFLEEAFAYEQLLSKFSITQQELAKKIGKSQSTIANKLRILSLPDEVRQKIDPDKISERHARSLLKVGNKKEQIEILNNIKEKDLTVKDTEKLIEKKLNKKKNFNKGKRVTVYKDLRIFINTLKNSINEMREAGLDVNVEKKEEEGYIEYNIRLPKQKNM